VADVAASGDGAIIRDNGEDGDFVLSLPARRVWNVVREQSPPSLSLRIPVPQVAKEILRPK